MKNKNLFVIVKASVKARKVSAVMFCLFVVISFVLVFTAIGTVIPLRNNIDAKINNHILNRELVADFSEKLSDDKLNSSVEDIKGIDGVEDVYRMPAKLTVAEQSGVLYSMYELGWVHKYFEPEIVGGRAFEETESGVALVPNIIRDYNENEGVINEIKGEDLIGKTLELNDETNIMHKLKIVGAYDATDPIFTGKEILVPRGELIKYNEAVLENAQNFPVTISADKSYVVVTENPGCTDEVLAEVETITTAYSRSVNIDADSYNIAFAILLAATVFFVLLTVFGFYMFLKGNINARTSELALYRAIGYKTKSLFYVIFSEHLLLGACSVIAGIAAVCLIINLAVNPYLSRMFGQTFMEMTVSINPLFILALTAGYALVILLVCITAARRTEKTDLTILLRD